MSKFNSLVAKLCEVFQIDRPDLDFGIYRIMNSRAAQITRYLEEDLREKVSASLGAGQSAQLAEIERKLADAGKTAFELGMEPDMVPAVKNLRAELADLRNSDPGHEDAVFSHLLTFFSRYYEKGDYISKRRYKGDTYAIPYSGEEVVLHWANKDQYYIKSGESFSNYSFKLDDGRRVRFQLLTADTAKDNRKDNEENRLFALIPEGYSLSTSDEDGEEITTAYEPITESGENELTIHFTYQGYPKSVKKKEKNAASLKRILAHPLTTGKWKDLHSRRPTEKDKERTLLEKHLSTYTEKNTADYFIHKDLGQFLRNELDFYIKNEVMHLDDVQKAETFDAIKDSLRLIQTLREIALDLIRFLAQLEDFQKKLWLKKKFVTQTDYCLTLDRVPEKLYAEIAANDTQREEWVKLYAIDEIAAEKDESKELFPPDEEDRVVGYSTPLSAEFLKQNPHLLLDTVHFSGEFKAQLLAATPNLDDSLDGLVIHSENFQALNLLQERYREKVKCVYIDPPYNTGGDGFLYRDAFKHSSWITLMESRIGLTERVVSEDGALAISLDHGEAAHLVKLTDSFSAFLRLGEFIWKTRNTDNRVITQFSVDHESVHIYSRVDGKINGRKIDRSSYNNPDNDPRGPYTTDPLTGKANSAARPNLHFLVKNTNTGEIFEPHPDFGWITDKTGFEALIEDNRVFWPANSRTGNPRKKRFAAEASARSPVSSLGISVSQGEGNQSLSDLFGFKPMNFPKPVTVAKSVCDFLGDENSLVLDYFAGSGTTGHAVINLNREDDGKRKYILVEMGEHFDTVLRPRLKKVAYAADWKDGKPKTRNSGISHGFKYLRLESYEDVLNNLKLPKDESDLLGSAMGEDYQLGYMLDVETRASLLSVADFQKPFHYQLNIAVDSSGASEARSIDLVETFNYLIGLTVEQYERNIAGGYAKITGVLPSGEKVLILWRDCEKIGYEDLDKLCQEWGITPRQKEYDLVYLNGDHNLPGVLEELEKDGGKTRELRLRQIEPEFLERMFSED